MSPFRLLLGTFFFGLLAEAVEFLTIAEVTTVTKAWDDVFVLVHTLVDGGTPDGAVLWQGLLDPLDALGSSDDAADVSCS